MDWGIVRCSKNCVKPLPSARARIEPVIGVDEAQDLASCLLDEVGVRKFRGEERDVALELGPHGLEASDFEFQEACALEEAISNQEAVPAIDCVIGEIGGQPETEKHNKRLPEPRSPIMNRWTQHFVLFLRYASRDPRTLLL